MTFDAYDRRAERPLIALSLLFLVVLSVPIIETDLSHSSQVTLHAADYAIWLTFAFDYVTRLWLTDRRWHFMRHHLVELAAVLLPALRPLRLLRLFSIGNMLAARSRRSLITQAGRLVASSAVLLIFVASVAVLDAERGAAGSNIRTFPDALWWASTTITTVGYGDEFPVTGEGRLVAVGLMILGIALVGVLTASIAAWFVREVAAVEQETVEPLEDRISRLESKIDDLLGQLNHKGSA